MSSGMVYQGKTKPKMLGDVRKRWDTYFYTVCQAVGDNSACLSRKIGSVLVKDKSIISTGYNGPPRGVPHCGERYVLDPELRAYLESKKINPDNKEIHGTCPRYAAGFKSGEGLQWCVAGHAERNALINAARNGICTKGTKLYMDCGVPCTPCLVEIINAGVEEIIVSKMTFYDASAKYLLEQSGLRCRVYSHLTKQ
jgi:dCMP deaminase